MISIRRPEIYLVLAAVLLFQTGCSPSTTNTSTSTSSVPPISVPQPASETGKPNDSAFRSIGSVKIGGTNVTAVEIVDESKLSTMSDLPTPEELVDWKEVALLKLELLSIRRANQTGSIVPLNDGKRYLIASELPELWNANSQKADRIYRDESAVAGNTTASIAVSHDDKWFVATDKEGTLRVWEIESGTLVKKKVISKSKVVAVALSPDSNELLVSIEDQPARLLDAKTLDEKSQLGKDQSGVPRPHFIGSQFGAIVGQRVQIFDLRSNTSVAEFSSQPPYESSIVVADRLYFRDRSAYGSWDASTRKRNVHWDGQSVDVIANAGNGQAWTGTHTALTLVELESGKILAYLELSPSEKAFTASISGLGWLADSKVLVVASSNGLVRVWGTKESGDKLGLKPMTPAIAASSTTPSIPPRLSQLREIIDLRQLPRLARTGYENINDQFNQHYKASEPIAKCKRFYRHLLVAHGWKEVPSADSLRNELLFEKNDYTLAVRLKKIEDDTTEVLIGMAGHFDLRGLPPLKGFTNEVVASNRNSLIYKTPASRLEIESQLLRQFTSDGWSFVTCSNVSGAQRYSDHVRLNFVRNGISLEAYIAPLNTSPNERQVICTARPKTFWTPVPPGCDCIDVRGGDVLVETSLTLPEALSAYDQMLVDDGWTKFDSHSRADGHESRYFRGQMDLLLHFQPTPHQTVLVKQGEHRDDYWPWIKHSVEAAAFPTIEPVGEVSFNRSESWIEYSTRAPQPRIQEAYARYFAPKGLTVEAARQGDGSTSLLFFNMKRTTVLTIKLRPERDMNVVRIYGSAVEWTAALPSDPPQLMSFEDWLRSKAYRPALRHLDEYVREMNKLLPASPR